MATCTCFCHPHTQWGLDSEPAKQQANHPNCQCTCCGMGNKPAKES